MITPVIIVEIGAIDSRSHWSIVASVVVPPMGRSPRGPLYTHFSMGAPAGLMAAEHRPVILPD
jgi:hypothetical protein